MSEHCRESHGMTGTPTYRSWMAMKDRCYNNSRETWARYGGRGITVCDAWRESFNAFIKDMGERPEFTTLDRIDSDGNYEPGNCRWATSAEQGRNTSRVLHAVVDGETDNLPSICDRLGIAQGTMAARIDRYGVDEAVSKSVAVPGLWKLQGLSQPGIWAQDGDDTPFIGSRFGRLTVIHRVGVNKRGRIFACSCDCGGKRSTNLAYLVNGLTTSCGCAQREAASSHARNLNSARAF